MWGKKPTLEIAGLGPLSFSRGRWSSKPIGTNAGEVLLSLDGDRTSPAVDALALAKEVLGEPSRYAESAMTFASSNAEAREFMDGNGNLVLDGFTFTTAPASVRVELSLSDWPDAMITVVFNGRTPCEVLLAD